MSERILLTCCRCGVEGERGYGWLWLHFYLDPHSWLKEWGGCKGDERPKYGKQHLCPDCAKRAIEARDGNEVEMQR